MSMIGYEMVIKVPSMEVFKAYWYGVGDCTTVLPTDRGFQVTVDYGTDRYRAQYQLDRFASGLYFGQVTTYSTSDNESHTTDGEWCRCSDCKDPLSF